MKFLGKLDPMTILLLVVIFGVVITMSTQASPRRTAQASVAETALPDASMADPSLRLRETRSGKS